MTFFGPDEPGDQAGINKQGGDALAGSGAIGYAEGVAVQDGSYGQGAQGSAEGEVFGAGARARAGGALAAGGEGGVDQTTIGDININA